MSKLFILFMMMLSIGNLHAQNTLSNPNDAYLHQLIEKIPVDTSSVMHYTRQMEDSIRELQSFTGIPVRLQPLVMKLAVRDFVLGRYSNVAFFAREFQAKSKEERDLKNYLLLCAYAHLNDAVKFGRTMEASNINPDSELYHAVQEHCLVYSVDLGKVTTAYRANTKNNNKTNGKIAVAAGVAGGFGLITGFIAGMFFFLAIIMSGSIL